MELDRRDYYSGTYHGIFYKLMKENHEKLKIFGFTDSPKILDDNENKHLFESIVYTILDKESKLKKKAIKENVIASKIFSMVDVISVDGEIYTKDDITLDEWIESFTTFGSFNQQKFVDFIKNIPDVEYEFDIVSNRNPKVKHTIHLKGLKDFF